MSGEREMDVAHQSIAAESCGSLDLDVLRILDAWQHPIYRIAYRIVGQLEDAEEIRQIVFMKFLSIPGLPESVRNPGGWFRRCVVNESLDWLRRKKRQRRTLERYLDAAFSKISNPVTASENPVTKIDDRDFLACLMKDLTPEVRAILSLRFDEDLTVREIGEILGKPHTTIQNQLSTAIKKLRSQVGSKLGEEKSCESKP